MKRPSSDTARRAGLIAVAAALAAALGAVGKRLAGRHDSASGTGGGSPDQTFTCRCGAEYRVSGTDRHRVYWPAGAQDDAPVLGERCVECEAPLPGGRATAAV